MSDNQHHKRGSILYSSVVWVDDVGKDKTHYGGDNEQCMMMQSEIEQHLYICVYLENRGSIFPSAYIQTTGLLVDWIQTHL